MKMAEKECITKTELKGRGWTDSLIARFFPIPTKESMNPHYRCAPPVKLYDVVKIESIESKSEFREAKAAATKRSQRAKATAERRRDETVLWAENLPMPEFPQYSKDRLRELACEHYNDLWHSRGEFEKYAHISDSDDFLDRISVNFLRHEFSPYEERLFSSRGLIGADKARNIIRREILKAIAQAYPWLEDECLRKKWYN